MYDSKQDSNFFFHRMEWFFAKKRAQNGIEMPQFSKLFPFPLTILKPDLHTPTLSADFWNFPSKLKQMTSPILKNLWTVYRFWPDFYLDFAWNLKDFESADKIGVCKSGFKRHLMTKNIYIFVLLRSYRRLTKKRWKKVPWPVIP